MLSDNRIKELQKLFEIISPYNESKVGPCSYDLTTYVESVVDGVYKLVTKEVIRMPRRYIGICSARSRLEMRGLFAAGSMLIDPEYEGKLTFLVYAPGKELQDLSYMMNDLFQLMIMEVNGEIKNGYKKHGTSMFRGINNDKQVYGK